MLRGTRDAPLWPVVNAATSPDSTILARVGHPRVGNSVVPTLNSSAVNVHSLTGAHAVNRVCVLDIHEPTDPGGHRIALGDTTLSNESE